MDTAASINELAIKAKTNRDVLNSLVKAFQTELCDTVRKSRVHPNFYQDAVQEVLLQVLTCVRLYDPARGNFKDYLFGSVIKLLKELRNPLRRRRGMVRKQAHQFEDVFDYEPAAPEETQTQDVAELLVQLPSLHRDVVCDHYGIGRPQESSINQIAARRNLPNTKVKQVLHEAMTTLRSKGGTL